MATYKGREVELESPIRTPDADKAFKVYVRNPDTGNVNLVRFGNSDMPIRRTNDEARASFRARHNCSDFDENVTDFDKLKPRFWSCRAWDPNADFV
jgi:hypothetical protein